MLTHESEPLFGESTFIDASLVLESDPEGHLPFIRLRLPHNSEGVVECLVSPYEDVPATSLDFLFGLLQHDAPDQALGVEFEDLRDFHHEVFELNVDDLLVDSDEHVDQLLVADEEADD